jgi:hypothetical protein
VHDSPFGFYLTVHRVIYMAVKCNDSTKVYGLKVYEDKAKTKMSKSRIMNSKKYFTCTLLRLAGIA